jgi:predicted DNA-binding transcriptional regulator AlpA
MAIRTEETKLVRFRSACEQLGMGLTSGYRHLERGTFPVEVIRVGAIWKCRQADITRIVNGPADDCD